MANNRRRASVVMSLALALLVAIAAHAAGDQAARQSLVPRAVAFVRTLAKGDYQAAEADFTAQMKQAAPPEKLRDVWQNMLSQFGSFQDTGATKSVVQDGYTTVVVKTDFKTRSFGMAVTFDSAGRIAGMHLVGPP